MKPKIVFIASLAASLVNFRLHLMKDFIKNGYHVVAIAPDDRNITKKLNGEGIQFMPIGLARNGLNPLRDLVLVLQLFFLLRRLKPKIVFSYTIKPVIFGSIAAKLARVPRIYSMITGTGYIFLKDTWKSKLIGLIAKNLFRFALYFNQKVIFQNKDNLAFFQAEKLISHNKPTAVVNGSGVDIEYYTLTALPQNLSFLMIARLLYDKGVREYVAAARLVKQHYPEVSFNLVGWIDTNPSSIQPAELEEWVKEGIIHYWGKLDDVRPAIAASSVYILPSYAEGTPRTVLEAMAMGRPIITSDAPGCRETVVHGQNGFLVPIKNISALAEAISYFCQQPTQISLMGATSRQIALDKYDVNKVNACMLDEMLLTAS